MTYTVVYAIYSNNLKNLSRQTSAAEEALQKLHSFKQCVNRQKFISEISIEYTYQQRDHVIADTPVIGPVVLHKTVTIQHEIKFVTFEIMQR